MKEDLCEIHGMNSWKTVLKLGAQGLFSRNVILALLVLSGTRALAIPVRTNAIPPTVTAGMGDLGGKMFGRVPDPARTRHYYIAAETSVWDYAPEGADPVCGKPIPPQIASMRASTKV